MQGVGQLLRALFQGFIETDVAGYLQDDGVFGAIPVGFAFDFVGFRCMLRQGRGRRKNADQAFLHFLFAVLSVFFYPYSYRVGRPIVPVMNFCERRQ